MSDWLDFLSSRGAIVENGLPLSFGESPADYTQASQTTVLCDLSDKGILALEGVDTSKFLQGQTTADFDHLSSTVPLNGAFCTLQGRVLSNFIAVLPENDRVLLITTKTLIAPTLEQKTKYAAFFKTALSDASEHYRILGISGPNSAAALTALYGKVPESGQSLNTDNGDLIVSLETPPNALPASSETTPSSRFILLIPQQNAVERWQQLEQQTKPIGLPYWHLLDIQAGLADVTAATSTAFIPQMLNYHLTNTVSFTKGCYTGQEVVARMHYRGTLKRRLQRLSLATSTLPTPGDEISSEDGETALGRVVLAAPIGSDCCEALAVFNQAALPSTETFRLRLNTETIEAQLLPLPYASIETETDVMDNQS